MAYKWVTPSSVWLEDEGSGQFALSSSAGLSRIDWQDQARARLPDVAALLGAAMPASCQCSAIFPEGFQFCPQCGHALRASAPSIRESADWWGPAADLALPKHVPRGLAVTTLALGPGLEFRTSGRSDAGIPAPPNARCVFAAARYGFPVQRLLALAYTRNVLQYWDPIARAWHVMAGEDDAASLAFTASDYAWLPATGERRGEVALLPTVRGLARLVINPVSETYHTEMLHQARLASAPGAVRRHIACLVAAGEGVAVWSALAEGGDEHTDICAPAGLPAQGWSRPIAYDGRLTWLHEAGHLRWQPGQGAQWLPWPEGWSPRLALAGPTQSRDGRLWQLGHDGVSYSFLELGVENGRRASVNGARLGFGGLLFRRGHAVVDEPWDEEYVEDPHEDDALVLPLLRVLDGERTQASGVVLRFHKYTGTAEAALDGRVIARTTVEWIGRHNAVLDEIARIERPQDCVPIVYDGCLWLHHPDWPRMRGWQLEAQP